MKAVSLSLLASVTIVALSACAPQQPPVVPPPLPPAPFDRDVPFESYAVQVDGQETPGITFGGFEREAMQGDQYTLVVAHRGESPSTGYGLRVDGILTDGQGRYQVHVTLLNPDPELPQSDVLTYPIDSVIIEGYDKNSVFEMVVDATLTGPYEPSEVAFEDFTDDWIEEQLDPEGGVVFYPLVMQTSGVDTALAAYRELCPTTGYGITITRVTKTYDGLITVYVRLRDPAPGSGQDDVITQPLHSIRIRGNSPQWRYTLVIEE